MKIVVLATDCDTTWMVVNTLLATDKDIVVILEKPISKYLVIKKRCSSQGVAGTFGQLLFIIYSSLLRVVSRRKIEKTLRMASLSAKPPMNVNIIKVQSVNSLECRSLLSSVKPELVVINGTRIIGRETLSCCSARFINIHCGITPAYRGVHGAYWALVSDDHSNVGVTIHTVDLGIDTGDIIYQSKVAVESIDNFITYPIKQYASGIPLLLQAINDLKGGCLRTFKRSDLRSKIWFHPTIWFYAWNRFTKGVR